jgi:hypothetical protein
MFYFFLSSGMSFSVISSLFYGFFKLKKMELLYYNIEKKLRYIEYALDLNDKYRIHYDKIHSSIFERIQNLENNILNTPLNNLQKQSPKKNNLLSETNNTPNQFTIIDYDDTNNNLEKAVNKNTDDNSDTVIDGDIIIKNHVPRVKSDIEIELDREFDAELDYMDDYYNNPNYQNLNDKLIVKRSSNSFIDLTKKMIFG